MDTQDAKLLIASESVTDAELVARLLQTEFPHIERSTKLESAAADFERCRPDVLFLAFETLDKAQSQYLHLYRQCPLVSTHPHRTVVLCSKDEVRAAYELCKQRCFDDYILFWPMTHDTCRLPMAARQALRELQCLEQLKITGTLTSHARGISGLEDTLDSALLEHADQLQDAKRQAQREVSEALQGMTRRVIADGLGEGVEIRDAEKLRQRLATLQAAEISARDESLAKIMQPVETWASRTKTSLKPHMETVRTLSRVSRDVPPLVLVVDDDGLQRKLISRILNEARCRVESYISGVDGLRAAKYVRPDLILLDFALPDLRGIEVLKQLRDIPHIADVPVAMITGHSNKNIVVQCRNAGAVDFLVKPIERETLLSRVTSLLQLGTATTPDDSHLSEAMEF